MNHLEADLVYDDEKHEYSLDGAFLPAPSKVLDAMGFVSDFAKNSPRAQRFGTHVHKMVELEVKGVLDKNSLSEGLLNAYKGFKSFQKDHPTWKPILDRVEKPSFHPLYRYAGTPDLPMVETIKNRLQYHLVDIKTGCPCKSHELQTAAYEGILKYWLKLRPSISFKRWIVFLSDTKDTYTPQLLTDKTAFNAWLNTLGCYNWKKDNGYL